MKGRRGRCTAERLRTFGKVVIVMTCLAGFLYQTTEFFQMYLEYPTVVDIQVTAPSYVDMPSITICNTLGYKLRSFCEYFGSRTNACFDTPPNISEAVCTPFPRYCSNGILVKGLQLMGGKRFSQEVAFDQKDIFAMKLNLEDYMQCSIEYAGESVECNLTAELGSFYSEHSIPNICYSLYNHWGQPNKQRERIPKGAVMKLTFDLNATFAGLGEPQTHPKVTIPASPLVQIGFHSPYYMPSPFIHGSSFVGGEKYAISLNQQEKHLLPAPYQTNCTDFMAQWRDNGGKSPINQMAVLQKCKMEAYLRQFGCVPISVDYPHRHVLCPQCGQHTQNRTHCDVQLIDDCATYIEQFNQPCELLEYNVMIKKKLITVSATMSHPLIKHPETLSEQILSHVCTDNYIWRSVCSKISIDIVFENFEIDNLTYVPKYVILELFSVIGGYMGMWLGVSFIAVYDFMELLSRKLCNNISKKNKSRKNAWSVANAKKLTKFSDPYIRKPPYYNYYNSGKSFQ